MDSYVRLKERASELRREGWTYSEILKELGVAKSSLSLWLKDLPLTDMEIEDLKLRRKLNVSRGRVKAALSNRSHRLEGQKILAAKAEQEFMKRRWDPLFLVGVALYWGEGARGGSSIQFSSSSPEMVKTFVLWLEKFEATPRASLSYRLFTHGPYSGENYVNFWSESLKIPLSCFKKTVFKESGPILKKKPDYRGSLQVTATRRSDLLLKMKVWQNMLASTYEK